MSAYPGLGKVLMWAGVVLVAPSLVASVYFGIDVVKQWLAPAPVARAPLDANAHPIEVVARGGDGGGERVVERGGWDCAGAVCGGAGFSGRGGFAVFCGAAVARLDSVKS
jgi:hypothetical protein